MAKILVAMSGGVDSAVAVKLLLDEGHEVAGVTFTVENSPESEAAVRDAGLAAASYGIPHTALDLSREFTETVKADFVREYECGRTPNPCVECNRHIKFGALVRYAEEKGFDFIATGHYASLRLERGRVHLTRGADPSKDQSYM
ncbi:MAG: 7-cyano-7-deazaguanine synthase, partial [Clostridia bacterium]|nr:7-cyano-7-deazaguanine synthase [Clostridia bacterium]